MNEKEQSVFIDLLKVQHFFQLRKMFVLRLARLSGNSRLSCLWTHQVTGEETSEPYEKIRARAEKQREENAQELNDKKNREE